MISFRRHRHRHRVLTVLITLVSLLFMRFSMAAYSCPGNAAQVAGVAAMAQAGMPCAESMALAMDDALPNLCHAHCQAEHLSADTYHVPALAVPVELGSSFLASPRALLIPPGAFLQEALLTRTTAPPLAVRHCCFRI